MKMAFHYSFPFDWSNPIGYLIAIFLQFKLIMVPLTDFVSSWPFLWALLFYINAGAKDLKCKIKTINEIGKRKKLHSQIIGQLSESLDFYCCLKGYRFLDQSSRSHR